MLQQFQKLLENEGFLLPMASIMLMNDAWIKNNAKLVKNFGEKWERKIEEFLDLDLDFRIMKC